MARINGKVVFRAVHFCGGLRRRFGKQLRVPYVDPLRLSYRDEPFLSGWHSVVL